ncbi:MAG: peptidoglycan-N-acetylglucosamine deacetylase [Eubacteriaceae bacterium]|jgi:peptidoglycan/xylan/chitin deacetylase (PgdA/CDA1 family)|nr:peptidoglycan-N-acetylglucosamine deacetylase [Eubacteriaceae bacterium]MDK2936898.1 peptidoglycan-N-acetylglucosamine deacetylase [Eubacteriaceae bacterium]
MKKHKQKTGFFSHKIVGNLMIYLLVLTVTISGGAFAISRIVSATESEQEVTQVEASDNQESSQASAIEETPPVIERPIETDPYSDIKERLRNNDTQSLKVVFLTFDDGPSTHTPEVLDLLATYNIKATFFTNLHDSDDLAAYYQRIVAEGHTLANHTSSHDYDLYTNSSALMADIQSLRDYQMQLTGTELPKIFRFPGGSLNANETCIQAVVNAGYNYVDWNVSSGDGSSTVPEIPVIESNIINGCRQYDVSVVLCHAEIKDNTRAALPTIIETLLAEGYTFLPMEADYTYPRQLEI